MCKRAAVLVFFAAMAWGFPVEARAEKMPVRILSLEEVSDLALENNFDIQLVKYDILVSRLGTDAARSVYDTLINMKVSYDDDRLARNSAALAGRVSRNIYEAGISKTFSTGTTFFIQQSFWRERSPGASVFYDPAHQATSRLTVEQDLGRNFFGIKDRGRVKVAMKDVENARYLSFYKIEQTLSFVQKAYWDLVLLYEMDRIQQDMLGQAKRLYDLDQERFRLGLAEKPQLLGSEANYQIRQAEAVLSKSAVASGINRLKLLLNIDDAEMGLMPEDHFVDLGQQLTLLDSMERAFKNRQDYQQARNEVLRQNIILEMSQYGAWPEIHVKASFARNGLGDSFDSAVNRLSRENDREFWAAVGISMPLENRSAQAELKQSEYAKARAIVNAKYVERKVAIEIADQITVCKAARERLEYLKGAAKLQARKAEEQERIFRQGRSDSDTVIRYQNDALAARMQLAQAYYEYYTSLIELRRREGVLLKEYWDGEI